MNHISWVPAKGRIVITDEKRPEGTLALHPKPKIVILIKNAIRKLTSPEQIVVNSCAVDFARRKAFMLLPKHGNFVE